METKNAPCNRCGCRLNDHFKDRSKQTAACTCGNCIGYQGGVVIDSYTGEVKLARVRR